MVKKQQMRWSPRGAHLEDFARFIHVGTSTTDPGTEMASIEWEAAIYALRADGAWSREEIRYCYGGCCAAAAEILCPAWQVTLVSGARCGRGRSRRQCSSRPPSAST